MVEKEPHMQKNFLLKSVSIVIALGVVALAVLFIVVSSSLRPANSSSETFETFVIPRGQAVGVTARRLQELGVIKNARIFTYYVRFTNQAGDIQAGSYQVSPSQTPSELIETFKSGSEDVWITVLEGWRSEEIAESIASMPDLTEFDADEFQSIVDINDAEGTLFPETYLIPKEYTAEQVYELLTNTYQQFYNQSLVEAYQAFPYVNAYTFDEVMVMASLVQREARDYEQMRHVAGILWNRMEIGMALQVDATMQYVKGYDAVLDTWWATPLAADRELVSPFNTYQQVGLPPSPIANPGRDAWLATLDPLQADELFYIHDSAGNMHFAKTLDQHNANIQRYLR